MPPLNNDAVNELLQTTTITVLGLDLDPAKYAKVRVGWQKRGAPGWKIDEDVVIVRATEEDDDRVNRQRDEDFSTVDPATLLSTQSYIRVWRCFWTVYGPNALDNGRKIRSALFQQIFHDIYAKGGLYPVMDIAAPTRVPELFQGQWWERVDFACLMNEGVVETSDVSSIASAEVIVEKGEGGVNIVVEDIQVQP